MLPVDLSERTVGAVRGLSLLLNFEYLQAEFYARALDGKGLDAAERGPDAGEVRGGRRVDFASPVVRAFVTNAACEERHHICILRDMLVTLCGASIRAPSIDLERSFTLLARSAHLAGEDEIFDAFANDTNLLLAAYMFEDVVATAYQGTIASMEDVGDIAQLAGLASAEAGHSAIVRMMLWTAGMSNETNAISVVRQAHCHLMGTIYQGSDHGVGSLDEPTILAIDGRSLAWGRNPAQCRQIAFGNSDGKPGLFFPEGIDEPAVATGPLYTPIHFGTLAGPGTDRTDVRPLCIHPPERVELPAIRWDDAKLETFASREDIGPPTTLDHYLSVTPSVLELDAALVVGAVGIVATQGAVIQESMWHTDPIRHRYRRDEDGVRFVTPSIEELPGTTISILTGAAESYWHSLIDAALRLVLIDDEMWRRATRLLVPSTGVRQNDLIEAYQVPEWIEIRSVRPQETFRVETLILPSTLHGVFDFHASLTGAFFDRLLRNIGASPAPAERRRRLLVDRREAPLRRLVTEDNLVAALPGFEPVKLEILSIAEQARLFDEAEIIVAPHGAGLSNLGFARPGTIVIEMMMDTYRNWCFRRLAAASGLVYFCVLGRSLNPERAAVSTHLQEWTIDVDDVRAAVEQAEQLLATSRDR